MSKPEITPLLELPVGEWARLAKVLWDSAARDQDAFPISAVERAELERPLAAYDRDPEVGSSWDEVKRRITAPDRRLATAGLRASERG